MAIFAIDGAGRLGGPPREELLAAETLLALCGVGACEAVAVGTIGLEVVVNEVAGGVVDGLGVGVTGEAEGSASLVRAAGGEFLFGELDGSGGELAPSSSTGDAGPFVEVSGSVVAVDAVGNAGVAFHFGQ